MDLHALMETTLAGLGYELVDLEISGRKQKLLRVFIDKEGGITIDDCVTVSEHLSNWLVVEGVEYDRLEISSPGLDRPLRKEADFVRFTGENAQLKLRMPLAGQRNFAGILRGVKDGQVLLEIEGDLVALELADLDKARLVPSF